MTLGPKPFTSSLRIGTDITSIARQHDVLQRLLRKSGSSDLLRRYLAKIFNRLEWPEVETRLSVLVNTKKRGKEDAMRNSLSSLRFARWVAGRWAAKEAAIKAHAPRAMYMRQISILRHEALDKVCPGYLKGVASSKPAILIDPPAPLILMSREVAQLRGLAPMRADLGQSAEISEDDGMLRVDMDGSVSDRTSPTWRTRRARVQMVDRQLADLSISHDGDYAMATVLAVMEEYQQSKMEDIIDDGSVKERLHEPDYGDEEFHLGDDGKYDQLCDNLQ